MPDDHSYLLARLLKQFGKVSTAAAALLSQTPVAAGQSELAQILSSRISTAIGIDHRETLTNLLPKPLVLTAPGRGANTQLAGHRSHISHRSHSSHRSHTSGMGSSTGRLVSPPRPSSARQGSLSASRRDRSESSSIEEKDVVRPLPASDVESKRDRSARLVSPQPESPEARKESKIQVEADDPSVTETAGGALSSPARSVRGTRSQDSAAALGDIVRLLQGKDGGAKSENDAKDSTMDVSPDKAADRGGTRKSAVIREEVSVPVMGGTGTSSVSDFLDPEKRYKIHSIGIISGKFQSVVLDLKTGKRITVGLGDELNGFTVTRIDFSNKIVDVSSADAVLTITTRGATLKKQK